MLKIYSPRSKAPLVWNPDTPETENGLWLDLIDPNEAERRRAGLVLGTELPTRDQASALEISNRLRASGKVLRLNVPSFVRAHGETGPLTPLAFVLTPTVLASVRYAESVAFDQVAQDFGDSDEQPSGVDVFIDLIESIVNVSADRIEALGNDLSKLSEKVFSDDRHHRRLLRGALFKVGAMQRKITQIRSAMRGVSRIVTYLCEVAPPWIDAGQRAQFKSVQADILSLTEFDQRLSDRLQFVLDAVLGFINNEQNDIMRVLTIVSVATMPPMILAGIWGMNFKSIPEYEWKHGYAFALTMITLSIALPLIWFRLKKWL